MRFSFESRVGAVQGMLIFSFMLAVYPSHLVYAQQLSTSLTIYDDFDERFLDPTKWLGDSFGALTVLESVREIQDEKLRLTVRNHGATDSNQGTQFGATQLHFTNPYPKRTIATQFVVRGASGVSCPASTGESYHAGTIITGFFFNSGSGNENDDVGAYLAFENFSSSPAGTLIAEAFLSWQGRFFGDVTLGTINVGQKVIAELSWDQPNSQFVVSWTDVLTGKVTRVSLPYTMPDTTLPVGSDKLVGARVFAPNCIGTQGTFAEVEATFDKVWIGN